MTDTVLIVLLWQIVLVGGWAAGRRLRRLERTFRSPCYAQVGALREQVVALHDDQAFDAKEQARRLRDLEGSAGRSEAEVRLLLQQQERLFRTLMQRLAQLEQGLGARTTPGSPIVSGSH